jgi:hypothetical protein
MINLYIITDSEKFKDIEDMKNYYCNQIKNNINYLCDIYNENANRKDSALYKFGDQNGYIFCEQTKVNAYIQANKTNNFNLNAMAGK